MSTRNEFTEKMEALDDIALLKVVKLKDEYQKEAADAAIFVALKRNLINDKLEVISTELIDNQEEKEADDTAEKHKKDDAYREKRRKKRLITRTVLAVIILFLALSFHFVPSHLKMFPKDNLTFSYTIITQNDVDKLLERYNDCETIFQQQSIRNEPLFRKLSEKGIMYDIKK